MYSSCAGWLSLSLAVSWAEWEASYHIEGDDILEGDLVCCQNTEDRPGQGSTGASHLTGLVPLDEDFVHAQRGGPSGQAQDEGVGGGRSKVVDAVNDVVGDMGASGRSVVLDEEPHVGLIGLGYCGIGHWSGLGDQESGEGQGRGIS